MGSPPKPWERAGGIVASSITPTLPSSSSATPTAATASSPISTTASSTPLTVPERPASFNSATTAATTSLASPYSYGTSPYNRFGLGSTYGGPYGSTYGSMGYGGMGYGGMGYGGMNYGGMGYGGMGGYGGLGMGMMGPNGMPMNVDPNGNPSLSQTLEATTQHTFALLHSIVQTFSGVAQMLESTFMATHSSFFAMVGVIDQFGQLRNALGSVLGFFGLFRWIKETITGRPAMQSEFRQFINGKPVQGALPPGTPQPPKPSKKPLIIFLLAIFGVPYAMHKLVKALAARAEQQQRNGGGLPPIPGQPLPPLDPSQLTFARASYPFTASNSSELSLKENEIVAIMGKFDPQLGQEVDPRQEVENAQWWKGRTRDGREGWFPKKWVTILERKQDAPSKATE